jgi:hypothetical protein
MPNKVQKIRDYRPHFDALHGAKTLLKLSAEQREGCYFSWLGSLLLSAFAFEGYLNYLGRKLFPSWDSFERSLGPEAKTRLLADKIKLRLEEDKQPFQTIKALITFRNNVAHLKPDELKEEYQTETIDFKAFEPIKSDVEKFCNEANARRGIEDVERMMQLLFDHSGLRSGDPAIPGHESGSISSAEPSR